jgi:hypothetical protein
MENEREDHNTNYWQLLTPQAYRFVRVRELPEVGRDRSWSCTHCAAHFENYVTHAMAMAHVREMLKFRLYMFFCLTMSILGILLIVPLSMKISFTSLVQEDNVHRVFQLCSSTNPLRNLHAINVRAWCPVYLLCGILSHICEISTSHCSFYIHSGANLICIDMKSEIRTLMRIMSRLRLLRGLLHCEHSHDIRSNLY